MKQTRVPCKACPLSAPPTTPFKSMVLLCNPSRHARRHWYALNSIETDDYILPNYKTLGIRRSRRRLVCSSLSRGVTLLPARDMSSLTHLVIWTTPIIDAWLTQDGLKIADLNVEPDSCGTTACTLSRYMDAGLLSMLKDGFEYRMLALTNRSCLVAGRGASSVTPQTYHLI